MNSVLNTEIYSDNCENALRFSSISDYEGPATFNGLSLKYVHEGEEVYYINDKKYSLSSGKFLVGNFTVKGEAKIKSVGPVKGLCMDLSLFQTQAILQNDESTKHLAEYFSSDDFFTNKYSIQNYQMGNHMKRLFEWHCSGELQLSQHHFSEMIVDFITDQQTVLHQLNRLSFAKNTTKRSVFQSIDYVRTTIEKKFNQHLNIDDLAKEASLSVFNLIRYFKTVFGVSPYQYIIGRKMDFAKNHIQSYSNLADLAEELNFSSVYAFNKAFKQYVGCPPRNFLVDNLDITHETI